MNLRFRFLPKLLLLLALAVLQTSCIFTGLVAKGVGAVSDPRDELADHRGSFDGHYLGMEPVDGIEHHTFTIRGLLEGRDENQFFTLYIPDVEDHGKRDTFGRIKVQTALGRQTTRSDLEDHVPIELRVFAGSGSARRAKKKIAAKEQGKSEGEGEGDVDYPTNIRLYVRESDYTLSLYYQIGDKQYQRPVKLDLPFEERSALLSGMLKSLYIITVPLDIVLSPVVIPIALIVAAVAS